MSSWIFDPVFPIWIIFVVLIPAFAFFLWKEFKNSQRFLIARIIAQIIILISLLGIMTRPSLTKKITTSGVILLTENYQKSTVDSLLNKYPKLRIIRTNDVEPFTNSDIVAQADIPALSNEITFIAGEGISPDLLELMHEKNFKFIPGNVSSGIVQLVVQKPIRVNQTNKIDGIFKSNKPTVTIKIVGPSGVEDSTTLRKSGMNLFSFTITPKQTGLFLYKIESNDSSKVKENLPIEILPERKLNILFLQKFPTAETRYLKNFLAEKGHGISLRYQTSKTNFNYEYANTSSEKIDRITSTVAESKDLIFIDSQVLTEMSLSERTTLSDAIKNGLGLIILDIPEKGKALDKFLSVKFKLSDSDTIHISIKNSRNYVLPVQSIEIAPDQVLQPELTHNNRILSGYKYLGTGKVGFQLLRETYRVRLEGNVDDYSSLWSPLIDRTARTQNKLFNPSIPTPFPYYQDQSLEVSILSSGMKPSLYDESIELPLSENIIIDDVWKANAWAGKPGWHTFSIKEDSTRLNYFVSDNDEWRALKFMNYSKATRLAQSQTSITSAETKKDQETPIHPFIFFLMFLIASGFLWLAPKI